MKNYKWQKSVLTEEERNLDKVCCFVVKVVRSLSYISHLLLKENQ